MPAMRPGPSRNVHWRMRDQRVTGDREGSRPGAPVAPARSVLQRHDGQHADDADDDQAGLHDAGGDEADRGGPADPPGDRVQHDRGADAGQGGDDLEPAAPAAPAVLLPAR